MKGERACAVIKKFVGLRPKIYPFLLDDGSEHKKSKGYK